MAHPPVIAFGVACVMGIAGVIAGCKSQQPPGVPPGQRATDDTGDDPPGTDPSADPSADPSDRPRASDGSSANPADGPAAVAPPPPRTLADIGLDQSAMDPSADPCQDFHQYACGGWLTRTAVPVGRRAFSRLDELSGRITSDLRALLEQAGKQPDASGAKGLLGRFYNRCMDLSGLQRAGLTGVRELLDSAADLPRRRVYAETLAQLHRHGIWAGFSLRIEPADTEPRVYRLVLDNGALGLPDRRHYLDPDKAMERMRRGYLEHVQRVLELAGDSRKSARKAARRVLRLETELARASTTATAQRRASAWYTEISREDLGRLTRRFDWDAYWKALGRADGARVALTSREYMARVGALMGTSNTQSWRDYLRWRILDQTTPALPVGFARARAEWAVALGTSSGPEPARWQYCVQATDSALGWALARLYLDSHFNAERRLAATTAVAAMSRSLAARIATLPWLGEPGKKAAQRKLQTLAMELGQPASWARFDLSDLERRIGADTPLAGIWLAGLAWSVDRGLQRIGQNPGQVRPDWRTYPHRVDGYYEPRENLLVASAGLLQAPLLEPGSAPSVNLGALSMLVGHELIHSVDDVGAYYDHTGAREPWWTAADSRSYGQRAACLSQAHYGPTPAADKPLVRSQGLREDIADIGGLLVAFDAHQSLVATSEAEAARPTVAGLDVDRQFFVAAGQATCESLAAEDAETPAERPRWGQRSRAKERVNRAMAQVPGFASSFQCPAGTPMNPPKRCSIW